MVALVHRALSKDPEDRPADANEMRTALLRTTPSAGGTQLLPDAGADTEAVGVGAPPPGRTPAQQGPPPPPRGRSLQWLWALIISALLTVAVLLAVQRFTEAPAPDDQPTAQEQAPADPDAQQQAPAGAGAQEQPQNEEDPADAGQPEEAPVASEPPPDTEAEPAVPEDEPTG
jgi:hypothetical protein